MAHRLTYNSTNIDGIVIGTEGPTVTFEQKANTHRAGSGKAETINQYGIWKISFAGYFSRATYHSLIAWYSWARQGKTFSFAIDSGDTANTTLDGAAAAAQAVVPLTATTSLTAGDYCLIASADDDEFEQVEISSVSAGVSITAAANLLYTYASGDTFRHLDYYPALIHTGGSFNPRRYGVKDATSNYFYQHTFEFEEAP